MKKNGLGVLSFVLFLSIAIWHTAVMADSVTVSIPDNTLVQPYSGTNPTGGGWTDVIGTDIFNTTGIDVTFNNNDVTFKIHTPFPLAGTAVGGTQVHIADLALDLDGNGTFEKGIVLTSHGTFGTGLYDVSGWMTSVDLWKATGYSYGGKYDQSAPKDPFTQISTGVLLSSFSATQLTGEIDVTLTGVNSGGTWNNLSLFWGTGTCANDGIVGHVPEPCTMLLLGCGIVGIVGFGRKIRK